MSATTRDWLLQKLLKMRDSLTAVTRERDEAREERDQNRSRWLESQQNEEDLMERIRQMAPEKQFRVIYHPRVGQPYEARLRAVQSSNGVTIIHAEWDGTQDRYDEARENFYGNAPGNWDGTNHVGQMVPAGTMPMLDLPPEPPIRNMTGAEASKRAKHKC